jgi:membrane protease YdiL (CAAX protease family)
MLLFSSMLGGTAGAIVYAFAFIIPILLGIAAIWKQKQALKSDGGAVFSENEADMPRVSQKEIRLTISAKNMLITLPVIIPGTAIVFLLSLLFAYIGSLFGIDAAGTLTEPFFTALITYALLPAILEEILFRYIPIKLFCEAGRNKRAAIIVCATTFTLGHMNLLQIPYALAAGIIFAWLDIICESILPSVILHAVNNVISLCLMYNVGGKLIYAVLGILFAVSVCAIVIMRKSYIAMTRRAFSESRESYDLTPMLIYMIPALFLAAISTLA